MLRVKEENNDKLHNNKLDNDKLHNNKLQMK